MAAPKLTEAFRDNYRRLFDLARIRPQHAKAVDRWCDKVLANQTRYESIGNPLGIPWFFIAAAHMRESSLDFTKHLHNGDPLTAPRTALLRFPTRSIAPPRASQGRLESLLSSRNLRHQASTGRASQQGQAESTSEIHR